MAAVVLVPVVRPKDALEGPGDGDVDETILDPDADLEADDGSVIDPESLGGRAL